MIEWLQESYRKGVSMIFGSSGAKSVMIVDWSIRRYFEQGEKRNVGDWWCWCELIIHDDGVKANNRGLKRHVDNVVIPADFKKTFSSSKSAKESEQQSRLETRTKESYLYARIRDKRETQKYSKGNWRNKNPNMNQANAWWNIYLSWSETWMVLMIDDDFDCCWLLRLFGWNKGWE